MCAALPSPLPHGISGAPHLSCRMACIWSARAVRAALPSPLPYAISGAPLLPSPLTAPSLHLWCPPFSPGADHTSAIRHRLALPPRRIHGAPLRQARRSVWLLAAARNGLRCTLVVARFCATAYNGLHCTLAAGRTALPRAHTQAAHAFAGMHFSRRYINTHNNTTGCTPCHKGLTNSAHFQLPQGQHGRAG